MHFVEATVGTHTVSAILDGIDPFPMLIGNDLPLSIDKST
jgi:hypothetical protein